MIYVTKISVLSTIDFNCDWQCFQSFCQYQLQCWSLLQWLCQCQKLRQCNCWLQYLCQYQCQIPIPTKVLIVTPMLRLILSKDLEVLHSCWNQWLEIQAMDWITNRAKNTSKIYTTSSVTCHGHTTHLHHMTKIWQSEKSCPKSHFCDFNIKPILCVIIISLHHYFQLRIWGVLPNLLLSWLSFNSKCIICKYGHFTLCILIVDLGVVISYKFQISISFNMTNSSLLFFHITVLFLCINELNFIFHFQCFLPFNSYFCPMNFATTFLFSTQKHSSKYNIFWRTPFMEQTVLCPVVPLTGFPGILFCRFPFLILWFFVT